MLFYLVFTCASFLSTKIKKSNLINRSKKEETGKLELTKEGTGKLELTKEGTGTLELTCETDESKSEVEKSSASQIQNGCFKSIVTRLSGNEELLSSDNSLDFDYYDKVLSKLLFTFFSYKETPLKLHSRYKEVFVTDNLFKNFFSGIEDGIFKGRLAFLIVFRITVDMTDERAVELIKRLECYRKQVESCQNICNVRNAYFKFISKQSENCSEITEVFYRFVCFFSSYVNTLRVCSPCVVLGNSTIRIIKHSVHQNNVCNSLLLFPYEKCIEVMLNYHDVFEKQLIDENPKVNKCIKAYIRDILVHINNVKDGFDLIKSLYGNTQ